MKTVPSHETIKQIMNEVYNGFYLKWRKIITIDNAGQMLQEARELNKKYNNCDLCRHMLADLIECIEKEYRRRVSGE